MRQVVRAFLRNSDGKYLLVQHHKSDIWTLPGGHIDKWETLHQALKREIKEEFQLKIRFLWEKNDFWIEHIKEQVLPIAMYKIHYTSKQHGKVKKYEYIFHAEVKDIEHFKIQEKEIKDTTWLTLEEFAEIDNIFPQIQQMAKKLLSEKNS